MKDNIMDTHPSFVRTDDDLGIDALSDDAMQGLINIKYDAEDVAYQAGSYKEEGNRHIKIRKFDLAIENYTAGLKLNCNNADTNSQLHFNRGIAHFKLGNNRSALNDFDQAYKLKNDYFKAIFKAAECCLNLKRYDECLSWCQKGLDMEKDNKLLTDMVDKSNAAKDAVELAEQKRIAAAKRAEMESDALMTALKSHGVRFHPLTQFTPAWFSTHCPQGNAPKFASSTDQSAICWPVLLSYPELKKQDFVQSFNEAYSFLDLLDMVIGADAKRTDLDPAFKPEDCDVYFENAFKRKIIQVDVTAPLLTTLRRSDLIVLDGTPVFIVLCKHRKEFTSQFLQSYDKFDLLSK